MKPVDLVDTESSYHRFPIFVAGSSSFQNRLLGDTCADKQNEVTFLFLRSADLFDNHYAGILIIKLFSSSFLYSCIKYRGIWKPVSSSAVKHFYLFNFASSIWKIGMSATFFWPPTNKGFDFFMEWNIPEHVYSRYCVCTRIGFFYLLFVSLHVISPFTI